MRDDDAPGPLTPGSSVWAPELPRRGPAGLRTAVHQIKVRFGDQALLQGSRLPGVSAWVSGLAAVDTLSGIGGLPRGRLTLLIGQGSCGKLSLGLELAARASRDLAQAIVVDPARCFDPSALAAHDADLERLVVIRPPSANACGEAALSLARAGCGLVLLLLSGRVLATADSWLPALEGSASRSGTVVVAVAEEAPLALAHASSFTLGLERTDWIFAAGAPAGVRTQLRCLKNRVGAPGPATEIDIHYPLISCGAGSDTSAGMVIPAGAGSDTSEKEDLWRSAAV